MAYSRFSLKDVKEQLGIQVIEDQPLFQQPAPVPASEFLQLTLRKHVPLALAVNTEKSRSEWIIAPILAELRDLLPGRISVFSGKKFDVAPERGLDGFCDYLVSLSPEQYYICARRFWPSSRRKTRTLLTGWVSASPPCAPPPCSMRGSSRTSRRCMAQ